MAPRMPVRGDRGMLRMNRSTTARTTDVFLRFVLKGDARALVLRVSGLKSSCLEDSND